MKFSSLISVLCLCTVFTSRSETTLDVRHLRDWTIVTAEDALPSEQYAAAQFRDLFEKATGLRLALTSKPPHKDQNIFIGPGRDLASSPVSVSVSDLSDEGLRIRITPENIAIAGGRPRGTLYGVYEFAERYLGVRFLTPEHTYVPTRRDRKIPCEEWHYVPPFTFRWSYYKENADHPEFAARLRVNTVTQSEKLGGVTPQHLISHTLGHFLPASRYGKEHPEYFALVNGERKLEMDGGGPEPCVSNPEVIEIVAQNVIKELDANPGQKNISVSQNDNAAYCRCEACEAINQREGTPMGSHLAFVNAVAERVERKYPDVKIGTLAYWYSRKPPKTLKPRANVQIQLCSIECSTLYPLDDPGCSKNRAFCEDMNVWGQMCDDIWIWNYNTNFRYYDLPFPNLRIISPNVRYFLTNKVKGVFMQANGNGNTGEMCDLRNYVLARCLWNPGLDSWALTKEFCRLQYGKAGGTIIDYLTYLHQNALASGYEPTCFPMPFEVGLKPASAEKIFGFFRKAMREADDLAVRERVEKASICAYRAVIETCGQFEVRDGRLRVVYPDRFGALVPDYIALTKKYGQTRAEEWQPIDHYYQILNKATQEGYRAAQLENKIWKLTVLGEDNGKIVELHHKPSGKDLLTPPDYRSLRRLFENLNLSETGEQGYNSREAQDFVIRQDSGKLALAKILKDGSRLERTIQFDPRDPGNILFRSEVSNGGSAARKYQMRVRPEFYTGCAEQDSREVAAFIKDGKWLAFNDGWKGSNGPMRSQLEHAQGGGYALFNRRRGFGVKLSYDPGSFARPGFVWNDTYPQANLDLYTKAVSLEPGGSFHYEYQISFLKEPPKE